MSTLKELERSYAVALRNLTDEEQKRVESNREIISPQMLHARRCYENLCRARTLNAGKMSPATEDRS